MVRVPNGTAKWLIGISATILVSFLGWTGKTLISHEAQIAARTVEALSHTDELGRIEEALIRIDAKLDRLIERRQRKNHE